MAFDPYLYVALAAGVVAGYLVRPTTPWVGRATLASVFVLVGLLGASLAGIALPSLLLTVPVALGLVALVLGFTTGTFLLLSRLRPSSVRRPAPAGSSARFPVSVGLLAALVVGYGLGRSMPFPAESAIPYALYALLALVGFGLRLSWGRLPSLWVPVVSASVGAVAAAGVFAVAGGASLPVALAATLGFGFYSLAGPLVAASAGAVLGLLAFLTNFLRENLTMVLAPSAGRSLGGEGLTAWGGATSMDTTLYFVTRYGDADAGSLAIASGLILTLVATVALPALLAVPR